MLQQRLDELYMREFRAAHGRFCDDALTELSYPFLVHASPEYLESSLRVMFVGKETNRWLEEHGKLAAFYKDVEAGVRQCVRRHLWQFDKGDWNTPFLRMHKEFAHRLELKSPRAIVWNNLLKCDWDRGRSDSRVSIGHSAALRELSANLFRAEVEILTPDFIVFACGADYDRAIKLSLGHSIAESVRLEARAFWTFKVGSTLCVRLRHPGARSSKKFAPTRAYYERALLGIQRARSLPADSRHWPGIEDPVWKPALGSEVVLQQ